MRSWERFGPVSDLIFRGLFSLIFLVAGLGHFVQKEVMLARLEAAPLGHLATLFGPPDALMTLSGVALVAGGIALALGFQTRFAALGLFFVLVPITVATHLGDPSHVGPMFKNVALMGGLLHFVAWGAGAYGIDERRDRPAKRGATA